MTEKYEKILIFLFLIISVVFGLVFFLKNISTKDNFKDKYIQLKIENNKQKKEIEELKKRINVYVDLLDEKQKF